MGKRMKLPILLGVLLVLVMVVSACAGGAAPAAESGGGDSGGGEAAGEPIKIGAIFDLTGPTADVSTPYSQGVEGYVDWVNQNGGVDGRQIDLISQDYAYKVDQAEQLYSQYVDEGVVAFMGWGTGDTEALRSRIAADEIPFMSASYSAALNSQEEAPYNFLVGTTYSDQLIIALQWALQDWADKGGEGAPKVAVMHHNSPFGTSPVEDGQAFAEANGMEFIAVAMPSGATDLTPELSQVESFGANYIMIQNVSSPAALLVKDKGRMGMDDVQVVCLNWCADENLINLAEGAAEGVVGAIPFTPPSVEAPGQADPRAYLEAKGESLDEIGLHYTQGWTTMDVMMEGIRRTLADGNDLTGANIKAALETISEYDTGGITSPITFTSEDHAGSKSLRLFQVQDGKWQAISDYISVAQ